MRFHGSYNKDCKNRHSSFDSTVVRPTLSYLGTSIKSPGLNFFFLFFPFHKHLSAFNFTKQLSLIFQTTLTHLSPLLISQFSSY
jgi:hypothetical protein